MVASVMLGMLLTVAQPCAAATQKNDSILSKLHPTALAAAMSSYFKTKASSDANSKALVVSQSNDLAALQRAIDLKTAEQVFKTLEKANKPPKEEGFWDSSFGKGCSQFLYCSGFVITAWALAYWAYKLGAYKLVVPEVTVPQGVTDKFDALADKASAVVDNANCVFTGDDESCVISCPPGSPATCQPGVRKFAKNLNRVVNAGSRVLGGVTAKAARGLEFVADGVDSADCVLLQNTEACERVPRAAVFAQQAHKVAADVAKTTMEYSTKGAEIASNVISVSADTATTAYNEALGCREIRPVNKDGIVEVKCAFNSLSDRFKADAADVGSVISSTVTNVGTVVADKASAAVAGAGDLLSRGADAASNAWSTTTNTVSNAGTTIANVAQATTSAAVVGAGDLLSRGADAASKAWSATTDTVSGAGNSLADTASAVAKWFVPSGFGSIDPKVLESNAASNLVSNAVNSIKTTTSGVVSSASETLSGAASKAGNAWSATTGTVGSVISGAVEGASNLASQGAGAVSDAASAAAASVANAGQGVVNAAANAAQTIGNIPNVVKDGLAENWNIMNGNGN